MSRKREKASVSDYRSLDVREIHRAGLLAGWRGDWQWKRGGEVVASIRITASHNRLQLVYQSRAAGADPVKHDYQVAIGWTPCHLGGERPWLHCPNCARRVAKLYGGAVFICRHCMRLNYPSQQASKRDRAMDRAWTLRHKLGCDAGPFDYPAEYLRRPKGMHQKTFARRIEQLSRIEAQAMADTVRTMQKLGIRIDRIVS